MKISKQISGFFARRPFVVVMLVSALVVGVTAIGRLRGPEIVEAQITFDEDDPSRPEYKGRKPRPRAFYDMTRDPNYLTAERLRDASSIALLLGLRRIQIFADKQPPPASVDALLSGILPDIQRHGILPSADGTPGVLAGPHSTVYVRYRIAPFSVEVISIPTGDRHGDNIIVRLPADGHIPNNSESKSVSIFTHPYVREVQLPAPFSSADFITASGWKSEELRQSSMTPDQVNQLMQSLDRVR